MITPEELARDKELCEAATPGPWKPQPDDPDFSFIVSSAGKPDGAGWLPTVIDATIAKDEDRQFIAAARERWPLYLAEVERLRLEAEECCALRERMADLLTRTANALKGDPPPLTLHDWSDLAMVAQRTRNELARLEGMLDHLGYGKGTALPQHARSAER